MGVVFGAGIATYLSRSSPGSMWVALLLNVVAGIIVYVLVKLYHWVIEKLTPPPLPEPPPSPSTVITVNDGTGTGKVAVTGIVSTAGQLDIVGYAVEVMKRERVEGGLATPRKEIQEKVERTISPVEEDEFYSDDP